MALIITKKDAFDISEQVAFRQIENWANAIQWQPLTLNATNVSGNFGTPWQAAQFCVDGFGFVMLRGLIQSTGTLSAGTNYPIASLSTSYAPSSDEIFATVSGLGTAINDGRLDINTAGVISYWPSATLVSPYISLSGVRWSTF